MSTWTADETCAAGYAAAGARNSTAPFVADPRIELTMTVCNGGGVGLSDRTMTDRDGGMGLGAFFHNVVVLSAGPVQEARATAEGPVPVGPRG
jgi:hypothetical protein